MKSDVEIGQRRMEHASRVLHPALLIFLALSASAAEPKITYADHVLPIFRNTCLNCHNPDKHKAGLDLSSYQAAMAGSDSGKVIEPGNASGSLLLRLIMHDDEPAMPAKADKLPDSEIATIKKWIETGAPENSGSTVAKKTNDLPDEQIATDEKPSGPPPMPRDLLLEPFVRTQHPGAVAALASSPWAPLVAVAGQKQVVLYHTETREIQGVLAFPEGFPDVLKFDRSGRLLLAAGGVGAKSGRVVVWNVETGERVAEVGDEFDAVLAADISADHSRIALGGPNKLVKIFDAKDGRLLFKIKKHTDWVTAMGYTTDGKLLVTGDRAGGLVVWDAGGREMFTLTGHKGAITAVSCRGSVAATASEDGTIRLWNLKEGNQIKSWEAHKEGALSVEFTTDGRLVSCGRDRLAKVWDKSGKQLRASEPLADVAMRATLSGERLIAADWSGVVRVWNAGDGKKIGDLTSNPPSLAERLDAATKRFLELQQSEAAQDERQLAAAHAEVAKWTAAQLNVTLYAARKTLANRKADYDKTVEAAHAASAKLDKARGDLAAAEKELAEAPERIQARENAVVQAKQAVEAANASVSAANERVVEKQTLAQLANDFFERMNMESAKSQDDKVLAEVAQKAKESFDLLNGNLSKARVAFEARNADVKRASGDLAVAEQSLMQTRREIENSPDVLKKLRESVEETANRTAAAREAADKLVEQSAKPLKEAKARVDAIAADYENLRQQAVTPIDVASKN